jgi:prepilin-type N-terminal cleavage/methylation domain-containing protein
MAQRERSNSPRQRVDDPFVSTVGRWRARSDGGFTLLELIVTITIAGILMTIGMFAMRNFLISNREAGTARDVRSALRNASEASLSQGRTYCVYFTATTWTVYKSSCTVAADKVAGPNNVDDPSITLTSISFVPPSPAVPNQTTSCPDANKCAYFYPRGTALAGSLHVTRPGKTYTLSVEGLTSRVSMA